MSESITGYIDHIIFRNEDNGYTVMVLKGVSEEDELTLRWKFSGGHTGSICRTGGEFYTASGLWKAVSGSAAD